jgi:hypothetical protein
MIQPSGTVTNERRVEHAHSGGLPTADFSFCYPAHYPMETELHYHIMLGWQMACQSRQTLVK